MVVLSLPVLAVVLGVVVWKVSFLFLVALSDDSFSCRFTDMALRGSNLDLSHERAGQLVPFAVNFLDVRYCRGSKSAYLDWSFDVSCPSKKGEEEATPTERLVRSVDVCPTGRPWVLVL